jgi:uncharacterized protein (TIGR02118 family)
MIKSITFLKKKANLTDEEFYRYWKEKHGPLAARVIPGLRKYVQNHIRERLPEGHHDIDGILELWFDDLEACHKYMEWRRSIESKILHDDEEKFIDNSTRPVNLSVRYLVEEQNIM